MNLPPIDLDGRVEMIHGAGGRSTARLIRTLFHRHFANPMLEQGDDGARIPYPLSSSAEASECWVVSTDAHVVSPLIFPGGDIGQLAVHGTINDLAMMGAMPVCITATFILEEGLPLRLLDRIAASMADAAKKAGAPLAAGDTKVVERGKGDGLYISTSGLGRCAKGVTPSGQHAAPGDRVLLSGTLGDHAMALLMARNPGSFETPVLSDTAALNDLVSSLLDVAASGIHVMRDPTRGGLGNCLNEIAEQSRVGIRIEESSIPLHPRVRAATELLGLDPLYLANEGKMILIADACCADRILSTLRQHPLGRHAQEIGEVVASSLPYVEMRTSLGGRRLVDWLSGEPLPRIC